jgi:hypothetical protein
MIVIYGLDILKSYFTPTEGFDMTDDRKFADFKVADETCNMVAPILKIAKGCWTWLANHQDVKARRWCPQMITEEFLEDLDICFRTQFDDERQYNFIDDHDSWTEHLQAYSDAIATIFDTHVGERMWEDPSEKIVGTHLDRKREWTFLRQNTHYSIVLPVMTVSVISALATAFERVPKAFREVSHHILSITYPRIEDCSIRGQYTFKYDITWLCKIWVCTAHRSVSIRGHLFQSYIPRIETFLCAGFIIIFLSS